MLYLQPQFVKVNLGKTATRAKSEILKERNQRHHNSEEPYERIGWDNWRL